MSNPVAQVQVSVNGGAWVSGGIASVPFGATVDLRNATSAGVRSYVWELTDYPTGMPCPAGWSSVSGVYTYSGATPPRITLPASGPTTWGKIGIRLRLNGNPVQFDPSSGDPVQDFNATLSDTATVLSIASPGAAMPGFMFGEGTQFDAMRSWAGAVMANLRALDGAAAVGVSSVVLGGVTYTALGSDRFIWCSSANDLQPHVKMPLAPAVGETHTVGWKNWDAADVALAAHAPLVDGNGKGVEAYSGMPAPNTYAATTTVSMPGGFATWTYDGTNWVRSA